MDGLFGLGSGTYTNTGNGFSDGLGNGLDYNGNRFIGRASAPNTALGPRPSWWERSASWLTDRFRGGGSNASPTFQFSKADEKFYKEKYPEFYNFVINTLPKIVNNQKFMEVLSNTSGFSIEELTKMFKSDTQYGLVGYQEIPFSNADYPHGDKPLQYPINLIRMNNKTLDWFEMANKDTTTFEGIRNIFHMAALFGHEINHWGESAGTRMKFGSNVPGDAGDYFEHMLIKNKGQNYLEHRQSIGDPGKSSETLNYYVKKNFQALYNAFNK